MSDAGMLGVLTEEGSPPWTSSGTVPYLTQRSRATTLMGLRTARWPAGGMHCCLTLAARSSPAPSTY
ncbi:hypothetical protein HaLaN_22775 [Haematococcus lacustris]|uniref:Uncharacterized protein n=1 Tax=Haematococcus lacustris TaxID=44745 RepID=A0A699ZYU0_HAELA|nr:hypothetical protein HaLaN_22775 [Haematococcus lacustris]